MNKNYAICENVIRKTLVDIVKEPHPAVVDIIMKRYNSTYVVDDNLILSDKIKPTSYSVKTLADISAIKASLLKLTEVCHLINATNLMFVVQGECDNQYIYDKIIATILNLYTSSKLSQDKIPAMAFNQVWSDVNDIFRNITPLIKSLSEQSIAIKKCHKLMNSFEPTMAADVRHLERIFECFIGLMNSFMSIHDHGVFNDIHNGIVSCIAEEAINNLKSMEKLYSQVRYSEDSKTIPSCGEFIETFNKFTVFCTQMVMIQNIANL